MDIGERKVDHISICLYRDVESKKESNWFEFVYLVHQALPELNLKDVDISTTFLGKRFKAPLLIDCMTGGPKKAQEINSILASVASELGIGLGVGSQRAALENPEYEKGFAVVRDVAPDIFVMANIGAPQLKGLKPQDVRRMIDMVRADALVVHLNPLQEVIQVEGEPFYSDVLSSLEKLVKEAEVPVIVKEVGCGISRETVLKLEMVGVKAVNVAGLGGTSWAGVEAIRAQEMGREDKARLGKAFWDWGIPTAASILEVRSVSKIPLIASGGIRNGIEIAKALALGADMVAFALPIIKRALKSGKEGISAYIEEVLEELRTAMFLTGSKGVEEMKGKRYILTGKLKDWVEGLGGPGI